MSVPAQLLAEPRVSGSKLDLVNATIAAIATHGLSGLTSARIAGMAEHTAASINFHFGSKEALLLAPCAKSRRSSPIPWPRGSPPPVTIRSRRSTP